MKCNLYISLFLPEERISFYDVYNKNEIARIFPLKSSLPEYINSELGTEKDRFKKAKVF